MPRLIAFGCSITHGDGLSDCIIPGSTVPKKLPSKLAYPNILADQLNIDEVINNAESGSSNLKILHNILSFKNFQKDDIAIIQWSFSDRDTIFCNSKKNSWLEIGPHVEEEYIKDYYRLHTEYDQVLRSLFAIHYANLYLKPKVKTLVHLCFEDEEIHIFLKRNSIDWFDVKLEMIEVHNVIDKALDGSHPGLKTHSEFAKQIEKILYKEKSDNL